MVFVCAVRKCVNSKVKSQNKDCKLHKIPNDKTLVHEWLQNCDRLDLRDKSLEYLLKNVRVCGKHFTTKMLSNPEHTRLLPKAVPTEFGE
ncbi:52 kDa repressor of the inhibitor of the protein kinase-like [Myzus persicae]|uniref:52 kDa repressor of the inhibitor of the protein kinase-like n=1 Tax=Myzus persicae TaxID=13164 RepID=UPI000B9395E5|nr:52 kDa repressor of the inhibitor of the protein kinase-like [Myzus persicae]